MSAQTYHIWQSGPDYRFRFGGVTYKLPWSLGHQRELMRLLSGWYEDAQPVDPRQVKPEYDAEGEANGNA
jgi:hypothetical protein